MNDKENEDFLKLTDEICGYKKRLKDANPDQDGKEGKKKGKKKK